jgi:hypothetical protein
VALRCVQTVDRFDELRRVWIAEHQGWSTIQRRRAERLGRRIRLRQRAVANAVPDPHDDTAIPPLWLRTAKSPAAQLEMVVVTAVAVTVPVGWLGGWILACAIARLIPLTLRSYPIAALLWSGATLGMVIPIGYDPGPSLAQVVAIPWLCAQVAAVPAVAGVYGLLDGWLAVPCTDRWWPLTPARRSVTAAEAMDILGGYDTTAATVIAARRLNAVGERST